MIVDIDDIQGISKKDLSKILFIFNALEDGWSIKKRDGKYIFSKHKGKIKEIYLDNFLNRFITKYFNLE